LKNFQLQGPAPRQDFCFIRKGISHFPCSQLSSFLSTTGGHNQSRIKGGGQVGQLPQGAKASGAPARDPNKKKKKKKKRKKRKRKKKKEGKKCHGDEPLLRLLIKKGRQK
jgi:hypothetical protein